MISDIIALASIISTIIMSIINYQLKSKDNKRNIYFKEIVTLYYHIDEVHQKMKSEIDVGIDTNINYYGNRIKVYSTILLNYIKKYPVPKKDIEELEKILLTIIVNPYWDRDYQLLMNEFQNFCWSIDIKRKDHYQFTRK